MARGPSIERQRAASQRHAPVNPADLTPFGPVIQGAPPGSDRVLTAAATPSTILVSSSSVTMNGGEIWRATPRRTRVRTPWARAAIIAVAGAPGCSASSSGSSCTAAASPTLRTSATPSIPRSGASRSCSTGLQPCHALNEALPLEDLQVDEAGDARARVTGVGPSLQERCCVLVPERRPDRSRDDHRAERHVAGRVIPFAQVIRSGVNP